MKIAWDAILKHSNGKKYDPSAVSDTAKQLRLMDKLDNWQARVYPSHLIACATQLGVDPGLAKKEMALNQAGKKRSLSADTTYNSLTQAHDKLEALDKKYEHRLVPYAITEQRLRMNRITGECEVHYVVDTDRISHVLQTLCTPEKFLELFDRAYGGRSMKSAAEVIHSIRTRIWEIPTHSKERVMKALFHFTSDKNHIERREFSPTLAS